MALLIDTRHDGFYAVLHSALVLILERLSALLSSMLLFALCCQLLSRRIGLFISSMLKMLFFMGLYQKQSIVLNRPGSWTHLIRIMFVG
jgi:hypothetical protein